MLANTILQFECFALGKPSGTGRKRSESGPAGAPVPALWGDSGFLKKGLAKSRERRTVAAFPGSRRRFELMVVRIWPAVIAIFFLGMAVRVLLLSSLPPAPVRPPEALNIAISLVRNGTFSDPFGRGPTGPTAYCMPLFPLLAALLIRIFGLGSSAAFALSCFGSAGASLGYALLPILGRNCSLNRWVGISAGLYGALLPVNFWSQTGGEWEAPFTLLTLVWLASVVAKYWGKAEFTLKGGALCGIAAAVATLFSPNTILILGMWSICAFIWFSKNRLAVVRYFATACLIVLVALAPWAIRNRIVLGRWLLTRSNFGVNLHISNNSIASSDAEINVHNPTWQVLNPYINPEERLMVKQMGEVAYDEAKKEQAIQWIQANPKRFWELTLERIILFWFPRMLRLPQTIAMDLLTILAIAGVIRLRKAKPEIALLLGGACIAYSSVFVVVEVFPRYCFPIEGFLLILASYAVYSWVTGGKPHFLRSWVVARQSSRPGRSRQGASRTDSKSIESSQFASLIMSLP
jgi:hypothetical protein